MTDHDWKTPNVAFNITINQSINHFISEQQVKFTNSEHWGCSKGQES